MAVRDNCVVGVVRCPAASTRADAHECRVTSNSSSPTSTRARPGNRMRPSAFWRVRQAKNLAEWGVANDWYPLVTDVVRVDEGAAERDGLPPPGIAPTSCRR